MGRLTEIRFEVFERTRRREFNTRTQYVAALFHNAMSPVFTGDVRKMLVVPGGAAEISDMIDVAQVGVPFDVELYWASDEGGQKSQVADGILAGALRLAAKFSWEEEGFVAAREKIRGQARGEFDHGKTVASPSRQKTAQLRYYYGPERVQIVAVVRERQSGSEIVEVPLVETEPHELRFVPYLGRLRWSSEEVLRLVPRGRGIGEIVRSIEASDVAPRG